MVSVGGRDKLGARRVACRRRSGLGAPRTRLADWILPRGRRRLWLPLGGEDSLQHGLELIDRERLADHWHIGQLLTLEERFDLLGRAGAEDDR
jgi:hypothetical protein